MTPLSAADADRPTLDVDQRVTLRGVSWRQFEQILGMRGDDPGVRISFREGELELMTPSRSHERITRMLGRLIAVWAAETRTPLNAFGSWTLQSETARRGAEADECYVLGDRETEIPDVAIEVLWTEVGLGKLDVYRGLGVPEVWIWRRGQIEVYVLSGQTYARCDRSELLPGLDFELLVTFLDTRDQTQAQLDYQAALRRP